MSDIGVWELVVILVVVALFVVLFLRGRRGG